METIHYISDFRYFSAKNTSAKYGDVINALAEHIRYIGREDENVITDNLSLQDWTEKGKKEIAKRWDSRVALKFVMALPLEVSKENAQRYIKTLKTFISKRLNVHENDIGIAIHLHEGVSGNSNPHAHILVYPRDLNGKKLRLNKKDLSEFHREWQKTLEEMGYRIRKDKEEERIQHLGAKLYYDQEAQELYRLRIRIKELERKRIAINHRSVADATRREGKEKTFKVGDSWLERLKGMASDFTEKQKNALMVHFKHLGYQENDKLAIVLVNHRENKAFQRVMTVEEILSDKTLRYLRAMNSKGFSVYASINTLKPSATRRRKEDFNKEQKRIYLDLDSKKFKPKELVAKLYQYLALKGLPQPTHIVKSSKGNYQVYWVLNKSVDWKVLERIMEQMNNDLGLDHTQDVSRVFRLPYFRNKKPGKDDLVVNVNVLKVSEKGKEIAKIEATGKAVSFDTFKRLIEPVKLPEPKPMRVKQDFGKGIEEEWKKFYEEEEKRRRKKRIKELVEQQGYSVETAKYRLLVEDYLKNLKNKDIFLNAFVSQHIDLIDVAFERNKGKSPSEVDMGITGLFFSRYGGILPRDVKVNLKSLLTRLARTRDKRSNVEQLEQYAENTIAKAESYWKKKRLSESLKKIRLDNDFDNDFGMDL